MPERRPPPPTRPHRDVRGRDWDQDRGQNRNHRGTWGQWDHREPRDPPRDPLPFPPQHQHQHQHQHPSQDQDYRGRPVHRDYNDDEAGESDVRPPVRIRRREIDWPLDEMQQNTEDPQRDGGTVPTPDLSQNQTASLGWLHHSNPRPEERTSTAACTKPEHGFGPNRWDAPARSMRPVEEGRGAGSGKRASLEDEGENEGRSPSPDPMLAAFLSQAQAKEVHTSQEAEKLFAAGVGRKSRFTKEKEEAERRRKVAEAEAAEAYKDFLVSMDQPASRRQGQRQGQGSGFVAAGGQAYRPARGMPPAPVQDTAAVSQASKSTQSKRGGAGVFGAGEDEADAALGQEVARLVPGPPPSKRAKLNSITDELRKAQEAREAHLRPRVAGGDGKSASAVLALEKGKRAPSSVSSSAPTATITGSAEIGIGGSANAGTGAGGVGEAGCTKDPGTTTNVCIHSLPGGVDEAILGNHFSQFGDVGTVKIMWPRPGSVYTKTHSAGLDPSTACTAFIAFMQRTAAEVAVEQSNGSMWRGAYLSVVWAKPVASLPSVPQYAQSAHCPSPEPDDHQMKAHGPEPELMSSRQQVALTMSTRPDECARVEELARQMHARGGPYTHEAIMKQASGHPEYEFLSRPSSFAGLYLRMLLDKDYEPLPPAPPFLDDGVQGVYDADEEEEQEEALRKQRGSSSSAPLGRLAQARFEAMLRALTPRRERIARAMQFAIEHAYAANDVAGTLLSALLLPTTPVPRKLARLWVVSDVLHNSGGFAEVGASQAWRYRDIFAEHLPRVCAHWGDVAHSFPGRIKQEGIRVQVNLVIDTWDQAHIFPPAVIDTLRGSLNTGTLTSAANTCLSLKPTLNSGPHAIPDPKPAPGTVATAGAGAGADEDNYTDDREDGNDDDAAPSTVPLTPLFSFIREESAHSDRGRSLSPGESVGEDTFQATRSQLGKKVPKGPSGDGSAL